MKLSDLFAKLTFGKAKVFTTLSGLAIAGAAMTVATPAAKAQVAFGVQIGRPRYYAPAPAYVAPSYGYGYGYDPHAYWAQRRAEEWRQQEWREHEGRDQHREFDRDRRYDNRGWR